MSFHIELTAAQARAVAALAAESGAPVSLRQLVAPASHIAEDDVYATVRGRTAGIRITREGDVHEVEDLLPAP